MNFIKFKWLYFLISALVIIPGLISLFLFGFQVSVDFSGGSLLEFQSEENLDFLALKDLLKEKDVSYESFQEIDSRTFLLRLKTIDNLRAEEIKTNLEEGLSLTLSQNRFEMVGPALGKELVQKTIFAIVLVSLAILIYIWLQFKDKMFGVCALLAMLHDSLVLLGSFSLLGHFYQIEIDTLFVTAVLTTLSLSIHDTVVVYDRLRESQKLFPQAGFPDLANKAITETVVRSLNNSLTIIFMLLALLLLGGETIRHFVIALLIGALSGTYSSTFVAVPLLVVWKNLQNRHR